VAMVARAVITISRQVGSGGDEIALKVCKILGYAYLDKSLIVSAIKRLDVSEKDIADFSEDAYRVKSLMEAIDDEECLSAIQSVIKDFANMGRTVIVGRGGQTILKDEEGVLHVRIVAPLGARVERIAKSEELSREAALQLIQDRDKATAEYLRRFYNIDWDDPSIYDMILNTSKMDLETAAELIASVARKNRFC